MVIKTLKQMKNLLLKNFLANIEFSSYARYTEFINFISANKNGGFKGYIMHHTQQTKDIANAILQRFQKKN